MGTAHCAFAHPTLSQTPIAPRGPARRHHCNLETFSRSELHSDATVHRGLGAAVGALAGRGDRADAGHGVVVEAELVLPVAVGHPEIDEVRVLVTPDGLPGVEGQTDRFAVELDLGRGARTGQAGERGKAVESPFGPYQPARPLIDQNCMFGGRKPRSM